MSHDRVMYFQLPQPFQSVRPIQSTLTEALLIVSLSIIGFASSSSSLTLDDPAETQAMDALEEGTKYLEEGNVEAARDHYKRSVGIQKSAAALFNLGVSAVL
jgi:Tfp pilus assembly protein PilF